MKREGQSRSVQVEANRGVELRPADIRAIRQRLGQSQLDFARMISVSVATLQNWEQGRRKPVGPAQALLRIAAARPQIVAQALGSGAALYDGQDLAIVDARILSRMATA